MSLGREHGLVLIGLAGPMDVVNLSLSLYEYGVVSVSPSCAHSKQQLPEKVNFTHRDASVNPEFTSS